MLRYKDIEISRLWHDGFLIRRNGQNIFIDPFQIFENKPKADYILLTHGHSDHLSIDDIMKIIWPNTQIVAPKTCESQLKSINLEKIFISQNDILGIGNIQITTIPAYNTNKFREPGVFFHPKDAWFIWYILDIGGTKIFHTWDSDLTDEMKKIRTDIFLVPVSWTYVMTRQEAKEAVEALSPKIIIPMHFGSIVGSLTDAENLQKALWTKVVILEKE